MTSRDFFISSAIDLGFGNKIGGTAVSVLFCGFLLALLLRAALVAQMARAHRTLLSARGDSSDASTDATAASCCDWNTRSVYVMLVAFCAGEAIAHFNFDWDAAVHLSIAFAAFLLLCVSLACQTLADAHLERLASLTAAQSSRNGSGSDGGGGGGGQSDYGSSGSSSAAVALSSEMHKSLVNGVDEHSAALAFLAAFDQFGVPRFSVVRRYLAAGMVACFVAMFALLPFSLAAGSACELAQCACMLAIFLSWIPDMQRMQLHLEFKFK